jgi:ATP-dependent Clp protease ATP-binding subunit ClpA
MFERFTNGAREIVLEAKSEAGRLGAPAVGSEHLLIALAGRGTVRKELTEGPPQQVTPEQLRAALADKDAEALAALGISLPEVQRAVEETLGPEALAEGDERLRFRKDAKRALELALREALSLGMRRIDAHVLLLGLLYEPNDAAELLTRVGVDPTALYTRTRESLRHLADAPR